MKIDLYHGSSRIIERPEFGVGNTRNDYGLGFYCTENLEMAKEWSCSENTDGFANIYILETSGLVTLNLSGGEYHILNWLAILLENRTFSLNQGLAVQAKEYIMNHFLPEYKSCDVIRGYRADDSYFAFASAFLNGSISLRQLRSAMRLGKLGEQVVLKSRKAFDALSFCEAVKADNALYYPKKASRDRKARDDFRKERDVSVLDDVFILDIIRNEWNDDDPRLR